MGGLLTVMARTGYARATVGEIARQAGLSAGLVHYHFKDKREILIALMGQLAAGLGRRVARRLAEAPATPHGQLKAFIDAFVALGLDAEPEAVAAWVVLAAEAVRDPEVRELFESQARAALADLRRLIVAVLKAEKRPTRGATRMAAAAFSMIQGAYLLSAASPGLLPPGFAAPMLHQALRGMLASQEEP